MPAEAKEKRDSFVWFKRLKKEIHYETIDIVNVETGFVEAVDKNKIKDFWDNLDEGDKLDVELWSYEEFIERINRAHCYYLKRKGKVVAIGGIYLIDLNICLWLLVRSNIYKYPKAIIKAVRTVIKKELSIFPKEFTTVLAMPHINNQKHHKFLKNILNMRLFCYDDPNAIFITGKQELLKCVNQQQYH